MMRDRVSRRLQHCCAAAGMIASAWAVAAKAAEIATADGWQVNLDTTLSAGMSLRASPVDEAFVGRANGGTQRTPNADDGTLNFRNSLVTAAPLRITEELDAKHGEYGLFVRATAFYDPVYDSITPDFRPFPRATVRDLGADARLLDAFLYWNGEAAGHRLDVKLGNQVINWGESIFLPGGINSATPFDANALESPGTELREAVLPVPAIDVSASLTRNLSLEAFYEFAWVRTRFAPDGSFFEDNDTVSDGGRYGIEDTSFPDTPRVLNRINLATNDPFGPVILRGVDRHPPDQGEFGAALRYSAPFLNDTELGLYFETYHSRTPAVSYVAGSLAGAVANDRLLLGAPGETYNSTARVYDDYPGDIHLLGASFSASLPAGIGLQGEISHRFDQPLVTATPDAVLQLEAPYLCQLGPYLASLGLGALGAPATAACRQAAADPAIQATGGIPGFGRHFAQYARFGVTQAQISATKLLPPLPALGIASLTLIGELGADVIPDFPREAGILNALYATANNSGFAPAATTGGVRQKKNEVTQAATGGVAALTADLPHALPWGILFEPYVAFAAGLTGRDATGEGPFQEGQDSVALGANFLYLQRLKVNVSYVNHVAIGTGSTYDLVDRDYVSLSASYNF